MINFYDIFGPCVILYPFSPTAASTSPKKISECFIYRLYILLINAIIASALITQTYLFTNVNEMAWTVLNKPFILFANCIFFTMILAHSMKVAKKTKTEKLMSEINELGDIEFKVNDLKYKIINAVFALVVIINHVGCSLVNAINTEGAALFLLYCLTFICITTDSEIIILNSFMLIIDAKMKCFVLQLQDIIEKKFNSRICDFYDQFSRMLHILKIANNIWSNQIFLIIHFELLFATRSILKLFAKNQQLDDVISIFTVIFKSVVLVRHFLIYAHLGVLGQWISDRFNQITLLANSIHDMDLGEDLNHQMWKISRLAAICPGQLQAGTMKLDGQLPLKTASMIISAVIIFLQFGVAVY